MPIFRAYPQVTTTQSTDAILLDRLGVGTEYAQFVNIFSFLLSTPSYANDAAAAAGGVLVGQLYRNGSVVQIRIT